MPTNKNALARIVLLDKLLADRYHAYSFQDMTAYLEQELPQYGQTGGISKRCVEKDIEFLEYNSPFDVELERYSVDAYSATTEKAYRKRCLRYADPTFSIFKGKLSEEEKGLLITALSTIGTFDGLDAFGWLDDLSKRLGLVEQRPIIQLSKNLMENRTLIAECFTAILNQSVVKVYYCKFGENEVKNTVISPYLLKEYNRRWYLVGAAYDTGRILNFALDRLDHIETLPGYDYRPIPEDLTDRFEDIIGVTYYDDVQPQKILFWASNKSAPYIETKPIHGSQIHLTSEKSEAVRTNYDVPASGEIFSIECINNYELTRELCSFGGELKVLAPPEIVDNVTTRIESMYKLYNLH